MLITRASNGEKQNNGNLKREKIEMPANNRVRKRGRERVRVREKKKKESNRALL